MNKRSLHHHWVKYHSLTLLVPLLGVVIFGSLTIYGLRANNLKMLELKQAVVIADEQNADVEESLQELRSHVNSHMNTNMRSDDSSEPPIQLVNKFNRYVDAEQAKITAQGSANAIYLEAQGQCENGNIPLTARAQCMQDYILEHGGEPGGLNLPPKELYTYDFASPRWSADLAGVSMIFTIIFGIALIIRLVAGKVIKSQI